MFSRKLGAALVLCVATPATAGPIAFDFQDMTALPRDIVISDPVTITGFSNTRQISVSGQRTAGYSIDGGEFVATPGIVRAGSVVRLRMRTSLIEGRTRTAIVEIGSQRDTWTLTTAAPDLVPEPFRFNQNLAARGATVQSNSMIVRGVNTEVQASISGDPAGEFSVNGGPYGTAPAMVETNDEIRLRIDPSDTIGAQTSVTLQVGSLARTWRITTGEEVEPNNSCAQAQDLALVTNPDTIAAERFHIGDDRDVDYYRTTLPPGLPYTIRLRGDSSSGGTMHDPLLGVFDSSCALLDANDDGGAGLDAQVVLMVPADGILLLAATGFPDVQFTGAVGYQGNYRLEIVAGTSTSPED